MTDPSLWEADGEYRAALGVIPRGDGPALARDNHPAERQSNPVSRCACGFPPVKTVKQPGQVLRLKARAAVADEIGRAHV